MWLWLREFSAIRSGAIFWPAPGSRRLVEIPRAGRRVPASTTGHPLTSCDILRRSTSVPSTGSAPAAKVGPSSLVTKGPGASSTGTIPGTTIAGGTITLTGTGDSPHQGNYPQLRLALPASSPSHGGATDLQNLMIRHLGRTEVKIASEASRHSIHAVEGAGPCPPRRTKPSFANTSRSSTTSDSWISGSRSSD